MKKFGMFMLWTLRKFLSYLSLPSLIYNLLKKRSKHINLLDGQDLIEHVPWQPLDLSCSNGHSGIHTDLRGSFCFWGQTRGFLLPNRHEVDSLKMLQTKLNNDIGNYNQNSSSVFCLLIDFFLGKYFIFVIESINWWLI